MDNRISFDTVVEINDYFEKKSAEYWKALDLLIAVRMKNTLPIDNEDTELLRQQALYYSDLREKSGSYRSYRIWDSTLKDRCTFIRGWSEESIHKCKENFIVARDVYYKEHET